MNQLSQFLLLVDFFYNLKPLLIVIGSVYLVICAVGYIACDVERLPLPKFIRYFWVAFIIIGVGFLVPNYRTMVMIGASEAGETAVNSDIGQAIINEMKSKLNLEEKEK